MSIDDWIDCNGWMNGFITSREWTKKKNNWRNIYTSFAYHVVRFIESDDDEELPARTKEFSLYLDLFIFFFALCFRINVNIDLLVRLLLPALCRLTSDVRRLFDRCGNVADRNVSVDDIDSVELAASPDKLLPVYEMFGEFKRNKKCNGLNSVLPTLAPRCRLSSILFFSVCTTVDISTLDSDWIHTCIVFESDVNSISCWPLLSIYRMKWFLPSSNVKPSFSWRKHPRYTNLFLLTVSVYKMHLSKRNTFPLYLRRVSSSMMSNSLTLRNLPWCRGFIWNANIGQNTINWNDRYTELVNCHLIAFGYIIYVHWAIDRVQQALYTFLGQTAGGYPLFDPLVFQTFPQFRYQLAQQNLVLWQSLNRLHQKTIYAQLVADFVLDFLEVRPMRFAEMLWTLAIYRIQYINIKVVFLENECEIVGLFWLVGNRAR